MKVNGVFFEDLLELSFTDLPPVFRGAIHNPTRKFAVLPFFNKGFIATYKVGASQTTLHF